MVPLYTVPVCEPADKPAPYRASTSTAPYMCQASDFMGTIEGSPHYRGTATTVPFVFERENNVHNYRQYGSRANKKQSIHNVKGVEYDCCLSALHFSRTGNDAKIPNTTLSEKSGREDFRKYNVGNLELGPPQYRCCPEKDHGKTIEPFLVRTKSLLHGNLSAGLVLGTFCDDILEQLQH